MAQDASDDVKPKRLGVLKFDSFVLGVEGDYLAVALDVYRHVRDGEKVVAVVSALAVETDALLDQAARVGGEPPAALVARLARVGELRSAALMALALSRLGVRACTMESHEMALVAEGDPLGSHLTDVQFTAVLNAFDAHEVVVVPGFTAGQAEHDVATTIANVPSRKALPAKERKLRVALLGCGAVGAGVLELLEARPDLFEVSPVLVRSAGRGGDGRFTQDPDEALGGQPDVVVELLGGADFPASLMCSALRGGAHVVTANKAAVAKHYDSLHACADAGGASLSYSGAVGGGTPILETLKRLKGDVLAVEGVMNGTANYLLSRLGEGWPFDNALKKAQELGFAEADPAADVDGHDAADKLSVLVREAFGVALSPALIAKQSLRDVTPQDAQAALARGQVLKQVGRCRLVPGGGIEAAVRIESLPTSHPLAGARNEENRFLVSTADGAVHEVYGKGAGRWPTTAAVFADVMDVQRALLLRGGQEQPEPVLLRA